MSLIAFLILTLALASVSAAASTKDAANDCGGTIREPGILKSPPPVIIPLWPGADEGEKQEINCIWHIEAPKDQKVVFKITQTLLDHSKPYGCWEGDDHIAIYDGLTTDPEKRLAIICNRRNSSIVMSSTHNSLTVQLKTDDLEENSGFISEIIFTYPESVGCGGSVNLTSTTDFTLKSPQVKMQGSNILDCTWNFNGPEGMAIKVTFSSFQIKCNNDYGLEIKDGNGPDSLLMGSYCGNNIPHATLSSTNKMSIRLSSDIQSNFIASLTVQEESCNTSLRFVGNREPRYYRSPGYGIDSLARGIHCGIEFRAFDTYSATVVRIKNLEIQPGSTTGKCDKDKLIIGTRSSFDIPDAHYTIPNEKAYYLYHTTKLANVYDDSIFVARQYELCGSHQNLDFYFPGTVFFNLITTSEVVSKDYKGVEIEVFYKPSCDRKNYTEPYGRILNDAFSSGNCSTLISAPEGYTISLYFINHNPSVMSNIEYLNIYDGDTTNSKLLNSTKDCRWPTYDLSPVFSTGNNLLLHNVRNHVFFDLVYMITNKGRGCGGYMFADQGVVTSPFYPVTYNEAKSCEFELETPVGTRVHIKFEDFDLGDDCASNFVQLLNRDGKVLSTICAEKPNLSTSEDNYVKIVSVTSASNRGKGWHVLFGSAS